MFWKKRQKRQEAEPTMPDYQQRAKYHFDVGALAAKGIHSELSKEAKSAILDQIMSDLAKMEMPEPPPKFKTVEEADRWLEDHS